MVFDKTTNSKLSKIAKKHNLSFFILFGSRATDKQKPTSDYDFAFLSKNKISADEEINIFDEIMKTLSTENIDLINLRTHTNVILNQEIFSKGKIIYESEKGFFSKKKYEAFFNYQDFKPYLEYESKLLEKRLAKL